MATASKVTTKKVAAKVATMHKPGWQTTEFWVTQLTITGVVLTALEGVLPPKYAVLAVAISQGAYAIARGITKAKRDGQIVESDEETTDETDTKGDIESDAKTK